MIQNDCRWTIIIVPKQNPATICFKSEIYLFLVLSWQMSLLVRMQQEGFNSQLCSKCLTPLAAALLSVFLTFGVESETHGNIARCCWEPWSGAAVRGVCLCLPTFSSHARSSFECALPSERPSRRLWMMNPHALLLLLKCVWQFLCHCYIDSIPPTRIPAPAQLF